jgi:hypothetical protein
MGRCTGSILKYPSRDFNAQVIHLLSGSDLGSAYAYSLCYHYLSQRNPNQHALLAIQNDLIVGVLLGKTKPDKLHHKVKFMAVS